jgi:hypothetical protein
MTTAFRSAARLLVIALLLNALAPLASADLSPEDQKAVAKGFELARKYCGRCHGEGANEGNAQFSIIDPAGLVKEKYVVPGNADESVVWKRIAKAEMPPDNVEAALQPSEADKAILKKWVELGAMKPARAKRPFRSELDILTAIRDDLRGLSEKNRQFTRYFSLTHLHNNSEKVADFDLRYYRAALAKALNSLTWEARLAALRVVDADSTILAIDLRHLGWDSKDWEAILEKYPYGLRYDRSSDETIAKVAGEVSGLCGSPISHLHADWFAVQATRPPLYDRLLDLPKTDKELETKIGVDVTKNIEDGTARRAGFSESGVSVSNRLVERHPSTLGYYWKSYDFKRSNGTGSLFQFPLGPLVKGQPFQEFAFVHDGGEMIFSLPNGLQGYFLTDGQGNRIDAGPIEVVRDLKETSGTPVVVNGVSCMHCHQKGMIDFRDSVREGQAVFGDVRKKTLELYPPQAEMKALVDGDRKRFLTALNEVLEPWLRDATADDRENFGEPIAIATRFYGADVDLQTAAIELGLEDPSQLTAAIKNNPRLRRLGLGPLLTNQKIDRQMWDSREAIVSPLQQVAREMDIATPYVILSSE